MPEEISPAVTRTPTASRYLGLDENALANSRMQGQWPPSVQIRLRAVGYHRDKKRNGAYAADRTANCNVDRNPVLDEMGRGPDA